MLNDYLEREANKKELMEGVQSGKIKDSELVKFAKAIKLTEEELIELGLMQRFKRWGAGKVAGAAGGIAAKQQAKLAGKEAGLAASPEIQKMVQQLRDAEAKLAENPKDITLQQQVKTLKGMLNQQGYGRLARTGEAIATGIGGAAAATQAAAQYMKTKYDVLEAVEMAVNSKNIKDFPTLAKSLNTTLAKYGLVVKQLPRKK